MRDKPEEGPVLPRKEDKGKKKKKLREKGETPREISTLILRGQI